MINNYKNHCFCKILRFVFKSKKYFFFFISDFISVVPILSFIILIGITIFPVHADLLSDLKPGETFQLPGSDLSSVLVDQNSDHIVDGIDFNYDGIPELIILKIKEKNAVGIDDNGDGISNFYITKAKTGKLIIINSLKERYSVNSDSASMKKVTIWDELSITAFGNYNYVLGDFSKVASSSSGGILYIDQGFDAILSNITWLKRHFWLPGFRVSGMYQFLSSRSSLISTSWIGIAMGPLWRIAIYSKHNGYFTFSPLLGAVNLIIQIDRGMQQAFAFNFNLNLGYEYHVANVIFSVNFVGTYIHSQQEGFVQMGGLMGIGYNINF